MVAETAWTEPPTGTPPLQERTGWRGGQSAWQSDHKLSGESVRDLMNWGFRTFPEAMLPPAIAPAALMTYAMLHDTRRNIARNLTQVMGAAPPWTMQRRVATVFRNYADAMATAYLLFSDIRNRVRPEYQNEHHFLAGLNHDRGLIVGTAHLGCWHVGPYVLRRWGKPVNVVMAPEPNPRVRMLLEGMKRFGSEIIYTTGSVFSSLPALAALKRGEIVAMQLDRLHGSGAIQVPFFGRLASFPNGPFVLARATGAPLLPTFIVKLEDGTHLVNTDTPVQVARSRDRNRDIHEAAVHVAGAIESWVRRYPLQWYNFFPYWDAPL